ncbi:hypothetical protein LMHCC_1779 [Listeria monocytogenes HCC23]|uniref:Uncharacterized protein n=1 Tax=Listeria monocytogenes serotype 4a (strain M7) TaxID=1030009 RepID=A0A0E0UV87_LISMM|nr:hypothetical protein LMHCC_1779 [Listeria monocytogenes HCC23]AEH91885.1 hypothetical protein LMM7_0880 [Listeria monocytogenes M7]CAR83562.1 hypothetical protein lmo4a_0860 [Listeria monocytogenes L99]
MKNARNRLFETSVIKVFLYIILKTTKKIRVSNAFLKKSRYFG